MTALHANARHFELAAMLQNGELLAVTVTGNCMAPLLRDGQHLMVQKQTRYRAGDILVFASTDGALLVHRYLGPAPGRRLMTKPDIGVKIDVLVPRDQVVGRVLTTNGAAVAITAASRTRSTLYYIDWLGRLTLRRILSRS